MFVLGVVFFYVFYSTELYGDPHREDAECMATSQRRLEKRIKEIAMCVQVQQSTYTVPCKD